MEVGRGREDPVETGSVGYCVPVNRNSSVRDRLQGSVRLVRSEDLPYNLADVDGAGLVEE